MEEDIIETTMSLDETLEFINNPVLEYDDEIWKSHPNFKDIECSNLGRIRRTYKNDTYIKRQYPNKNDNSRSDLKFANSIHGQTVTIYAAKFILECFNGLSMNNSYQCDHKNSTSYDNRIINLRWVENGKENMSNEQTKEKMRLVHKGTSRKKNYIDYNDMDKFQLKDEKWKKHPVYSNIEISNYGRIIEVDGGKFFEKVQTLSKPINGYYKVTIGKNENRVNPRVHRLVAELWVENPDPENKTEVDHINRDTTDNRASNLRWCTHEENMDNNSNKDNGIKVVQLDTDGNLIKTYNSFNEIKDAGLNKNRIKSYIEDGKPRSGFYWMYKDDYDNGKFKKYVKEKSVIDKPLKEESYHILSFDEFINL